MSLQSDLIQAIQALATAAGQRVYDELVPPGVPLPFVATTMLTQTQELTLSANGLFRRATVRVAVFSRTALERDAISAMIRSAYHGFKGTIGTVDVSSIRVEDSSDDVELSDGDSIIKGKGLDLFTVYY